MSDDPVVGRVVFASPLTQEEVAEINRSLYSSGTGQLASVHPVVRPSPTFFPSDVLTKLLSLENTLKNGEDYDEVVVDSRRLAEALRRWEKDWRADKARLVVQCPAKPNGEGGLSAPADFDDPEF